MAALKVIPIFILLLTLAAAAPMQTIPLSARALLDRQLQVSLGVCKSASDCVDRDRIRLKCVRGTCTPRTLGKACLTSADCSTFTACTSGTCQLGAPGAICTMWRQCALGNSCVDRVCKPGIVGASCDLPYNCGEGLTCDKLKCVVGVAKAPCRTNKDCASGLCRIVISGQFASGQCTVPVAAVPPAANSSVNATVNASPPPSAPAQKPPAPAQKQPAPAEKLPGPAQTPPALAKESPAPVLKPSNVTKPGPATPPEANTMGASETVTTPAPAPGSGLDGPSDPAAPASTEVSPASNENANGSIFDTLPNPSPDTTLPPRVCIGSSSHRAGISLKGLLRPVHRMQIHPLRLFSSAKRVQMHCYASANSRLCASASHIVEHAGKLMYMADFCTSRACTIDMEIPLNFKGVCGEHIEFVEGLKVTQHAAVHMAENAAHVARMECALRTRNRALWTVRTL